MDIDTLLERFGKDTGLGRLTLDDSGSYTFLVDEAKVSFMHIAEGGTLLLFADVGELPGAGLAGMLLAALRANFLFRGTAGATLAVRPGSPVLFLNRSLKLDGLSYEEFVQALGDFTNTLSEWRRLLADYRPDASASEGDGSGQPPFGNLSI